MFRTGFRTTIFINEKHDTIAYDEYQCKICGMYCCVDASFTGPIDCPYCCVQRMEEGEIE